MSSYQFTLDDASVEKRAVHLTNNAVQKYDVAYGSKEDGNILSYKEAGQLTGIDFHKLTRD
jgi:hypothetical protein